MQRLEKIEKVTNKKETVEKIDDEDEEIIGMKKKNSIIKNKNLCV